VVFPADGISEARSADGREFGPEGLARSVGRSLVNEDRPAEVMRQL
jgi:serine phosphatase RsbU (regulator of sigma subunit)